MDAPTHDQITARLALLVALILCCRVGLAQGTRGNTPTQFQESSSANPELEVVSIRPTKDGLAMRSFNFLQNGVSFRGISTKMLLKYAFVVEPDRIPGVPGWADSEEYDLQARVDDASELRWRMLPMSKQRLAILPILESRFNLRYHHETRTLPVWVLVVAKGGPRLHKATPGGTYQYGLKGPDGPLGARAFRMSEQGELTAQATTIAEFLWSLGNQLPGVTPPDSATIVDKTGFTGRYDITLRFTPENNPAPIRPAGETAGPAPSGPSIFTAL